MDQKPKRLAPRSVNGHTWIPLAAIALILLGLAVGSLLLPDIEFSPNENRYLQLRPAFSWRSLMDGDFTKKEEDHAADQIPLRDFWISAKSVLQRASGKTDINGIWLGQDGYYFAKVTEDTFDRENFEKNVTAVEKFFAAHPDKDCRILLAPPPASVLYDKLPYGAALYNEIYFDDHACYDLLADTFGERAIMVQEALRRTSVQNEVYYRTDHHWTTMGAYTAYQIWADTTRNTVSEADDTHDISLVPVSDSFRGTLYSKALLPDSAYDTVYVPSPLPNVTMEADGETYHSLLFMDRVEQKDVYEVFLGGNYAKAVIDTGAHTGRTLLLVKDSFANCFVPFLTQDYDTITMVDLRYCRENMKTLAEESSDILVLYELTNFAGDGNLFKLNLKK